MIKARKIQEERYAEYKGVHCNAQMSERLMHQFAEPDEQGLELLRMAMKKLNLSSYMLMHCSYRLGEYLFIQ